MKKFFKEFKEFAARGNVVELAIAVVIGGAFGKIVTSLVDDIIMPLFGILFKQNFATLTWNINGSEVAYGSFIQSVIDFLIIALCIFIFTKLINRFKKKEEKKEEKPKKSDEVVLLEEIRDLLKKKNK